MEFYTTSTSAILFPDVMTHDAHARFDQNHGIFCMHAYMKRLFEASSGHVMPITYGLEDACIHVHSDMEEERTFG
jgi:hypothetical protein